MAVLPAKSLGILVCPKVCLSVCVLIILVSKRDIGVPEGMSLCVCVDYFGK
jgi:hypothetical protein